MGSMEAQLKEAVSIENMQSNFLRGKRLTGNLVGRATFAGRDHNQKLHDGVIDLGAARLDDKDILFSNTSQHSDARLALHADKKKEITSALPVPTRSSDATVAVAFIESCRNLHWRIGSAPRRRESCPGSRRFEK